MLDDEQSAGRVVGAMSCDRRGAAKVFLRRSCEQLIRRGDLRIGEPSVIVVLPWPGQVSSTAVRVSLVPTS